MKIAAAISGLIALVVIGLLALQLREPVDQRTAATDEAKLAKAELPASLPALFRPAETVDADASFTHLLSVCDEAGPVLTGGREEDRIEQAGRVCDALVGALSAGPFDNGFVDDRIDPGGVFTDPLRQQFRQVSIAADLHVGRLIEEGRAEEADAVARARFELGRRVFVQNVRLRGRQRGLGLMRTGLGQVLQAAHAMEEDGRITAEHLAGLTADVQAWSRAIDALEDAWKAKLATIASASPNVADLVRVAEQDGDRSFRVFATHQLGYARYERGEPGNQRLIAEAIERARGSDDPLVKAAGNAAATMTREQFHTSER